MIIYKYILRNIIEKKLRTFLVLLSISLSAALLFATLGLGATVEKIAGAELSQFAGAADLIIRHKYEDLEAISYIPVDKLEGISGIDFHVGQIDYFGMVSHASGDQSFARIFGATLADFEKYNPIVFAERHEGLDDFSGDKIIISQAFSKKHGCKAGDMVEISFGARSDARMLVVGVAEPIGIFLVEQPEICIVPMDFASEALDAGGLPNVVYVSAIDKSQGQGQGQSQGLVDSLKRDIEAAYPQVFVDYVVNDLQVASRASSVTTPFMIASLSVFIMGLFIAVTSFNLIFNERLPSLGAFRSVGCTRKRMTAINLSEALALGLLGGALGCLAGVGVLNIIGRAYLPSYSGGVEVSVQIRGVHLAATVLFGVLLTLVGAIVPVVKISRIPLRGVILGDIAKNKNKNRNGKRAGLPGVAVVCALSAAVFALCVLAPRFIEPGMAGFLVSIGCTVLIIVATVFLITGVIKLSAVLFGGSRRKWKSAPLWMGMRNVTDNGKLLDIARLVIISVSLTVFIATLTRSVAYTAIKQNMGTVNYDYMLVLASSRQNELDRLKALDGVDDAMGVYTIEEQYMPSLNAYLWVLYGIDPEKFFDYEKTEMDDDTSAALSELGDGRNIFLTTYLARQLGVAVGDVVTLRFEGEDHAYAVTGIVNNSANGGVSGFISDGNIVSDAKLTSFSDIYVRAADAPKAMENTRAEFFGRIVFMETMDAVLEESLNAFMRLFDLLTAYAVLATAIGIVGIINNTLASFLERKRELAMLRSVGMSKKQLRSMLVFEAIIIAVFGALLSFAATIGMLSVSPYMMQFLWPEKMEVLYSPAVFGAAMLFIMACMSLVALVSVSRASKLSIIETLKYE